MDCNLLALEKLWEKAVWGYGDHMSDLFKGTVGVKSTKDDFASLLKNLKGLADLEVYVGIPEETSSPSGVSNAQLAYIHSNGSPVQNIPARPFIEPAIEYPDNKKMIAGELKGAAMAAIEGDKDLTLRKLSNAGTQASVFVKGWFTNPANNWPPLAEATIEARARRKYKISGYKQAGTKDKYRKRLAAYIAFGTFNPLIDTGALRKSITWVISNRVDTKGPITK